MKELLKEIPWWFWLAWGTYAALWIAGIYAAFHFIAKFW